MGQPAPALCSFTCVCHGGYVCERPVDPGDPTTDPPVPPGHPTDGSPHRGTQPNGQPIQWNDGECLTDEEIAAAAAQAAAEREAATHNVLQNLDPALLVRLLVQGGYVVPSVAATPPPPAA
jgi:hypothetical protein